MSVTENIRQIRAVIGEAAAKSGRSPSAVRLMAVTKTVDDERIMEAIKAGVDIIGENYLQEAKRKIDALGKSLEWHMIGHLQTNKARFATSLFDMIHSVDRIELARELDRRVAAAGSTMKILIEVNVSGETTKSGTPLVGAISLVRAVAALPGLSIQGLMTMPPYCDDPEESRPFFRKLRELRDKIETEEIPHLEMKELSMGMSGDYAVAIEEGATIVRLGTAIFGERPPRQQK
ncbi:MAG: YggS family pyridoxal phosphate-dependent enzyme [Syntrophales bacterium]